MIEALRQRHSHGCPVIGLMTSADDWWPLAWISMHMSVMVHRKTGSYFHAPLQQQHAAKPACAWISCSLTDACFIIKGSLMSLLHVQQAAFKGLTCLQSWCCRARLCRHMRRSAVAAGRTAWPLALSCCTCSCWHTSPVLAQRAQLQD